LISRGPIHSYAKRHDANFTEYRESTTCVFEKGFSGYAQDLALYGSEWPSLVGLGHGCVLNADLPCGQPYGLEGAFAGFFGRFEMYETFESLKFIGANTFGKLESVMIDAELPALEWIGQVDVCLSKARPTHPCLLNCGMVLSDRLVVCPPSFTALYCADVHGALLC
jgi:hypothetical protein